MGLKMIMITSIYLTHKDAPKDHFPFVLDYLKQFE